MEEVDPADGYSIINASETIYLADSGEQSVVTVRFDNAPDGILLIRKVCSVNPSVTLANAEFKITYADGTLIGDSQRHLPDGRTRRDPRPRPETRQERHRNRNTRAGRLSDRHPEPDRSDQGRPHGQP